MLIDVGVNLLNSQFRRDVTDVLHRAQAAGVEKLLVIATDLDTTAAAIDLCVESNLFCTAGIHPHDAAGAEQDWQNRLQDLASHPRVRAVGETGLDFNRNYSPPSEQLAVFAAQISIAQQLNKPLFIHDRESEGELLRLLQAAGDLPEVLIHCFTGTQTELYNYLDHGYYIGITGWVTDPARGELLRRLVPEIPLDRLVLETDAPFLRPANTPATFLQEHQLPSRYKRRCEPAMLPYVLEYIATLRTETADQIAAATAFNANRLFGIGD